jgi:hypothetical protein
VLYAAFYRGWGCGGDSLIAYHSNLISCFTHIFSAIQIYIFTSVSERGCNHCFAKFI